ncbi:cation:proton antiporter [Brooklawnia cerclae]|uniref:Kef-type K+ transport system membrane component KefB n=1 Tax=Brooklawnia cerclae TaxID=349934 RepID=A0ABX0SLT7_9ACTN|nr:cation:proton antiporter [Brooklawnia cerclae]NIH57726.1 Kef-type K+ transport system membrane component KefB [Brooklawnia cerclae]
MLNVAFLPLIAVVATLVTRQLNRFAPVPLPAVEIMLGLLAGPAVIGLVQADALLDVLSNLGGAVLFLIAGTEVDVRAIAGRPGTRALGAWGLTFVVLLVAGTVLTGADTGVVLAIALSSTAVGMLLPILKDAGDLDTPFGTAVVANGAVGEFLPLVGLSLLVSERPIGASAAVLVVFAAVAALMLWVAVRSRHDRLHAFIHQTQHTSSQFAIRLVFLILGALVAIDLFLGLDMLLGSFVTGLILRALLAGAPAQDAALIESKLQGLGFGLLVPVFFISAGLRFDLGAMLADPILFAVASAAAVVLFVLRGLPGMVTAPSGASRRTRLALGAYTGTALPIIVATTSQALDQSRITSGLAAALVGGGLLSVIIGPVAGAMLRRSESAGGRPTTPQRDAFVTDLG